MMNRNHDPENPTATAPDSVEESVYEETEYAGKEGPDAADPPRAARKSSGDDEKNSSGSDSDSATDTDRETDADDQKSPGSDLDVEEAADAFETREEAEESKDQREDVRDDEDIISLDTPD